MKNKQRGASAAKGMAASAEKTGLHPRNPHRGRYDFRQLIACSPELAAFVATNEYGDESIAFADPAAVKALNRALLKLTYGITGWDIPPQYLCPPIPGRADYLHYLADLLAAGNGGIIPRGKSVRVLDIGAGANCIYPLIGHREYGWQFVGTDIDPAALDNAQRILDANSGLSDAIDCVCKRHARRSSPAWCSRARCSISPCAIRRSMPRRPKPMQARGANGRILARMPPGSRC